MSSNNSEGVGQGIPQITTFQFSNDAVGQVKDSVNLFTGTANIPINIASLPGRKDLDVNIGIMYNGNVKNQVQKWNITNPTGILGLGWDMSFDKIVVNKNGSGSTLSDDYYLLSNGSGNLLVQDGFIPATNSQTYQLRNFEFWDIRYDPSAEKWTLIKEDGTVYIYGDKNSGRNTLQYGISWGNWLGNSNLAIGQEQYVTTWNLSEIQNTWSEKVTYSYDNVQVKLGSATGLDYTQASYVKEVVDSFNRTITFHYGEKYGATNPGTQHIVEYQAAHLQNPPTPFNAYQDYYETRYLDHIDVKNPTGDLQFTILFEYDFINVGVTTQTDVYPLMWKRVLTSFWQVQPDGRSLPGMEFEYYDKYNDVSAGALKAITYPQGARVSYNYKVQPLTTSRNMKVDSPMAGATPRVWFGSDYTVVTWYNAASKSLKATVYSWSGNWSSFQLNSDQPATHYFDNVDVNIDTLGVITSPDFIALYFVEKTKKQFQLFLYRRDQEAYGVFRLSATFPQYLSVNASTTTVSVTAGKDFVIASSKDFTVSPINAYQWNWKQNRWDISPANNPPSGYIAVLLPSPADVSKATYMAIAARNNYYITALYNKASSLLQFQLFYHDGNNVWSKSALYSTSNVTIYQDPANLSAFLFSLNVTDTFATATYITGVTATEVAYSIRTLQWDKSFNLLSPATPLVNKYTSAINTGGKWQYSVFSTILTDALIANNTNLNRYTGGPGSSNNPLNWQKSTFPAVAKDTTPLFATGQDISIMSVPQGTTAANQYLQFNPNTGFWGTPQSLSSGTNPTINGSYSTVGQDIYYQNSYGQWIKQPQQLVGLQAPQTVQNRGAAYIVYQDNVGASAQTYFLSPLNGIPGNPQKLPLTAGGSGQKVLVDQDNVKAGTVLAGADTFVTYPANQDFNTASSLALYKVVDGAATDALQVIPVAYIEIESKYDAANNYYQSYDYASSAQSVITYDQRSSIAQFPKVTVVTGSKTPSPASGPEGITINYFSNGVSQQGEIPYPGNWIYNYNQLLNGSLLQKTQYDKSGKMVSSETNYWEIFQHNLNQSNFLYGAFFRLSRSSVMRDGVTQTTTLTYFQNIGLQQSSATSYYDSNGEFKTITEERQYAIQVDAYNQAFSEKHLLNAVVQETVSVTDSNQGKKYTRSTATTWKNWADDSSWKWGGFQNYLWQGPANGNPAFDFTPNGGRAGWLKKQEVKSRGLPYSVITEMANVDGISTSYIYDSRGRFQIAEFPTASLAGGEASYYSFEPYEAANGWQPGGNAAIIPNANDQTIDAQLGTSSLKIGNGVGIQRSFTPENQGQDYIFSSYVKLPDGFDVGQGAANWIISFTQNSTPAGNDITLPFGNTVGRWQYVFAIIKLPALNPGGTGPAVTISIRAQNDNTTASVLIDALRFSPVQSLFAAVAMDTRINQVNAAIGSNGETRVKFFDDFAQVIATAGFSGETTSIASNYFSRTGNGNQFSTSDPNSKIKVLSAGGGPALSFTKGREWMQYWSVDSGSGWETAGGALVLKSFQTQAQLTYKGSMENQYGVLANVVPTEAITQPLGIKIGGQFTVQWQPSSGQWELSDASGTVLQAKKIYQFTQNTTSSPIPFAAEMRSAMLRRGVDISVNDQLLQKTANGIYDARHRRFFAVNASQSVTDVSGIGTQWSLLVNANSLFFLVDGQLLFNYVSPSVINGKATLFAGNTVELDHLLTSFDNQTTFTLINEAGNDIQSQVLANTTLTVIENIYDALGRIVVNTKPAFVQSTQAPLFRYINNFAMYNAADGSMTGLVNNYYPADGGYPYFGTRYEPSPMERVVELSMPGVDYKMGAHTQKMAYGTNDSSLGLPPGQYYQTTVTDQNGNMSFALADKRGQEVRKLSQKSSSENIVSAVYYDDAGNAQETRSPNYQQDGTSNWVTLYGYNFVGQLTSTTSNTSGLVNMVYDPANRLRFRQDAVGVQEGNFQYYKYDSAGRLIETGYLTATWNRDALQQEADTNPAYPPTPATWRVKNVYDYDDTNQPFQVGQLVKTMTHQSVNTGPDVEECFSYDIFGNVTSRSQQANVYDAKAYTTGFAYNNLGGITQIDYPTQNVGPAFSIYYTYNSIGQIVGVSNQASQTDNLGAYTYNPVGKLAQEVLNKYGSKPVTRSYSYNSPVWLEQVQDNSSGTSNLFKETLKTSATDHGGPSYYNGQSAEIAFTYPQNIQSGSVYTNWYNGISTLEKVDETSAFSSPVTRQYGFDNNGNFNTVNIGAGSYSYTGVPNKGNQLQRVTDLATNSVLFQFDYDANGAIGSYKTSGGVGYSQQELLFSYDPGSRMTTAIDDKLNAKVYNFFYSGANDRILKQQYAGSTLEASTYYVKSLSGNTLIQVYDTNAKKELTCIVYGPFGIMAFVKDGALYNTLKDHLGSVRVILDENADVKAAYEYDVYGSRTVLQEPEPGFFSYLYTSQEFDLELDIYNYKARFYFSRVGRFGVVDNYNQFYSPYIFAGNSPLIYVDPTGNFSIGNFFSAIGGAIIGAFEILIGVAVDVIAGILEVVTGGLSTPVSVGLASLGGAFLGAGISAVSYSAVSLITNDFSWKDYGINTAIGFVAGALTAGFGEIGAIAAEAATGVKAAEQAGQAVSTLARVGNSGIKAGFTIVGGEAATVSSTLISNAGHGENLSTGLGDALVTSILSSSLSYAIPGVDYKAGWGNLFKRMAVEVSKSIGVEATLQLGSNAVQGEDLTKGLLNTVLNGVVSGSVGGLGTKDYATDRTKNDLNFMNFSSPTNQVPANGIIRL